MHNDQQQQPDGVYKYVTLAPIGFLAGIKASLAALFGRLYGLRINDGSTRCSFAICCLTDTLAQSFIDLLKQPGLMKSSEVAIDGLPGRKLVREISPLASSM